LKHPDIDNFLAQFSEEEILVHISGEMSEDILNGTIQQTEVKLEDIEANFKKIRKVMNVLVETLQNLFLHTDAQVGGLLENGEPVKQVTFLLSLKNEEYNILAANYIEKDKIEGLRTKLDKINGLDKDGLRSYYKEVLNNGQYSVHGGGGLGMIDIARKSGNKLGYEFSDATNDFGLFIFKAKI